jgi:hypothetical protein
MEKLDAIRARYAKFILDVAESLPNFNGGVIANFQDQRKYQRKHAKEDFDRSRLPEGVQIRLHSFTLIRLYLVEDFKTLDAWIRDLFPKGILQPFEPREMIGESDSLRGSSWATVGTIVASREAGIFGGETATIPTLPPEIKSVSVSIDRVLPSLLALSFRARLADTVAGDLEGLQKQSYLDEITFRSWFPFTFRRSGSSHVHSETIRERTIHDFVESVRTKATKFLTRTTPTPSTTDGGFFSIDEYRLSSKTDPPSIERSNWTRQFGFAWSLSTFKNPIATVMLADTSTTLEYPHRVVALSDPPVGNIENVRIENISHDLVPLLSIMEILSRSENLVGGLRSRVFQRMSNTGVKARLRSSIPGSFLRDIHLNSDLQTSRMILARLQLEYEQQSQAMAFSGSGLKDFAYSNELLDTQKQRTNLLEILQKAITRNFALVSKHLQLAFESFSVHVSLRNTAVTYRLGRNVLWFTIVAAVATILGVIGSWPAIVCGFKSMVGYLKW